MKRIKKISEDYFECLAKNYPVMCLSDEFYFFPRIKNAVKYPNVLDSLDSQRIKETISHIKSFKTALENINPDDLELESKIDLALLDRSMSTFLIEFDQIRIWQMDPTLYLKIAVLGYNEERSNQIPRLLDEAKDNLKDVPAACREVGMEMIDASQEYFKKISNSFLDFKSFLAKRSSTAVFIRDKKFIEDILKHLFSYNRGLEEIFEIASIEHGDTLRQLDAIAEKVDRRKTWQEILDEHAINVEDVDGLVRLYSDEIIRLKKFIETKDMVTIPKTQDIEVRLTPLFMNPIRASASYASPLTDDPRERAYFYITSDFAKNKLHNEYLFVTAHETYPGHHLLDSVRRGLKNPIRQQIESPLFYEGWASYAERLIDELGYTDDPVQKMLGLKRQAWRAVRAMLDVGIRINKLSFQEAETLLKDLGYAPGIAKSMFRHYALLPGYQLCYTIGKFEIDRLRKKFAPKLGLKKFHDLLLECGEIPFDLAEKRLEKECKSDL